MMTMRVNGHDKVKWDFFVLYSEGLSNSTHGLLAGYIMTGVLYDGCPVWFHTDVSPKGLIISSNTTPCILLPATIKVYLLGKVLNMAVSILIIVALLYLLATNHPQFMPYGNLLGYITLYLITHADFKVYHTITEPLCGTIPHFTI